MHGKHAKNLMGLVLSAGLYGLGGGHGVAWAQAPEAPKPAAPAADAAKLPSGVEVLARFVEKTGGRAAYERHSVRIVKGNMEMAAMGIKAPYTLTQAAPDKYRMTIEIPGMGLFAKGSDGTTAWSMDAIYGPQILEGEEEAQTKRSMTFNAELEPLKQWKTVETIGLENVDGKPAYKVLLTPASGEPQTSYYEVETGLLIKSMETVSSRMGPIPTESTLSDYKEFDGIKVAAINGQKVADIEQRMTIERMEHPAKAADGVFDLPAEIKALLEKKAGAPAAPAVPAAPAAPTAEPKK